MTARKQITAWPVSDLDRVFLHDSQPRSAARRARDGWDLASPRGAYSNFQLGIRYAGDLQGVEAAVSDLRKGKDAISAKAVQIRWVGLIPVPLDRFDFEGAERPELAPGWYPDPLVESVPWKDERGLQSIALCFTVHVSYRVRPGTYRGHVTLIVPKAKMRIPVRLTVWPFALPKRPTFNVTNWFQPDCVTKWHRCEPWSQRHWRLLELYAKEMAAHRLNVIATPTLIGNFHNSDPMTLVDATLRKDGSFHFDMSRLDRWVKLFGKHGFEFFEMWHLLSQARGEFAPPLGFYDERKKERIWYEQLRSTSRTYKEITGSFLTALSLWLDRQGLTKRFLLHVFDEPKKECWPHYARMSAFFREKAPNLRHIDAISTSKLITDFGANLDIPVPLTTHLGDDAYYQKRAREGQRPVWWYTCCAPWGNYANRFVTMPLISGRMLFWQSFAHGISGYLHWGFNYWHRFGQNVSGWPGINRYADTQLLNPYREYPPNWAVGDTHIVYPHPRWWEDHGPVSSLRFEALRAGLQDYEMLKMLDGLACKVSSVSGTRRKTAQQKAKRLLAAVRGPIAGSLTDFTRDSRLLLNTRRGIGECISALV